jgi:uncharacterized protein (UPF0548 family)
MKTPWRVFRGWNDEQIAEHLQSLHGRPRNFKDSVEEMSANGDWHFYSSESVIAHSAPGSGEGDPIFERAREAVSNYEFSDPKIVVAYFDPNGSLEGRYMLLELKASGLVNVLGGTIVGDVHEEATQDETVFVFRYDTLSGHIERGAEWFRLVKNHATGEIRFRIEAYWQEGEFPTWWMRLGFKLLGKQYQERWHREAHQVLSRIAHRPSTSFLSETESNLVYTNPEVLFERTPARNVKH